MNILSVTQQHLSKIGDPTYTDFIISGAGGALRYLEEEGSEEILNEEHQIQKNFFTTNYGFVSFTINSSGIHMEFVDENLDIVYTYTRP